MRVTSTAASFDRIDDSVFVSAAGALSMTSAVSIEAWVKRSSPGSRKRSRASRRRGNQAQNYSLWFNALQPDQDVRWERHDLGSVSAPTALDTNWHHVVGTFDNSTMRIYVDGVQKASTNTAVQLTPNANSFYVGRLSSSTGYNFGGALDELAVYGTVLSPARSGSLQRGFGLSGVAAARKHEERGVLRLTLPQQDQPVRPEKRELSEEARQTPRTGRESPS